jgi:hypothetical protein
LKTPKHGNEHSFLKSERKLIEWILGLIRSDSKWFRRTLLRGLRIAKRHRLDPIERNPSETTVLPTGPYDVNRKHQRGDLLLWVPRRIESFIIDDLTGAFGYSHLTVDTGEVDLPTGKPVMMEATIGQVVERKFQDQYGSRPFARILLSKTGVDTQEFITCVISKMGEPFNDLEALTLGEIDDPSKQVCSSLAAECLPETIRRNIANARRMLLLSRTSVSVHSPDNASETKVFISPNGFAQYYRIPEGGKVHRPDFTVEPHPIDIFIKRVVFKNN